MKRFLSAVFLCLSLLIIVSFIIVHRTTAKEDMILALLDLPAPPPPNPWMAFPRRDEEFYSKAKPPADDAPIDDLLDYWARQNRDWAELRYKVIPSDRTVDRLLNEIERDPSIAPRYLNVLRQSDRAGETMRRIYENLPDSADDEDRNPRGPLREWLKNNTSAFAEELERDAGRVRDANEYVTNQGDLLNLTRVDWERAKPVVDQMYRNNSAPVSQVLAKWALYKHALAEDSIDVERYRSELIAVVEDRKATAGMRDLAFDALVSEREWPGRDEWYYKLMEDETLADLRVNGSSYTGLTTLIMYSPEDKYVDKMIDLLGSENLTVRNAAARNLLVVMSPERPQITRAMLPWIADPKWVNLPDERGRELLVSSLASIKMPEAVPALIAALDQKVMREMNVQMIPSNANAAAVAVNRAVFEAEMAIRAAASAAANAANLGANAAKTGSHKTVSMASYPLRRSAIEALGFQGDMRAVPALRRMLNIVEDYEKGSVVKAMLGCNGFTIDEQVNALETMIREVDAGPNPSTIANAVANTHVPGFYYRNDGSVTTMIGSALMQTRTASDALVNAVAARIAALEKRDPDVADVMRRVMANWEGSAVDALLLRDLRNGKDEGIVKLLARRKEITEKIPSAVFELRSGTPAAAGLSACFLDTESDYATALAGNNNESKAATLACARLVRGKVPIANVIPFLHSPDKRLALAAEKFLESEDSPHARAAVLSLHPGEAKILGATTAFGEVKNGESQFILPLFASVNDYFAGLSYFYNEPQETEIEKQLQNEVKSSPDLLGVYAYDLSFIRIYKDRAVFSWEEDEARYHERTLEPAEFEGFKLYLAQNRVDELPPFLGCREESQCSEPKELLMLGKHGGRRVYLMSATTPPFFAGLEAIIADLKRPPARLRYWLEKTVPGAEVLFSDENLNAETVWKNGPDIRVLLSDPERQKEAEKLIEKEIAGMGEDGDEYSREAAIRAYKIREAHSYDGYSWFAYSSGRLAGPSVQPPDVEFIVPRDGILPAARLGAWKARTGALEIRADETGIYKLTGGQVVKIRSGQYVGPIVTPDGRWVVASSFVEGEGPKLVRIDLASHKQYELGEDLNYTTPVAYAAGVGRVLLKYPGGHHYEDEQELTNVEGVWLDPATGRVTDAFGELRPLAQQTFRSLQKSSSGDFWAAIPDRAKGETAIGLYDSRTLKFTPRLTLPKIRFDSMKMWIDENEGRAYIVYEGHLLSVPLGQTLELQRPVQKPARQ